MYFRSKSYQKDISDTTDEAIVIDAADLKYAANGKYKAKVTVYDHGAKLASNEYSVGAVEGRQCTSGR